MTEKLHYGIERVDYTPTIVLAISQAAIDWGYKDDYAQEPEQVPYHCELTLVWRSVYTKSCIAVSTHGLIYAKADASDPTKFGGWSTSRFEIDYQTNADVYALENTQDNLQGFEFDCLTAYADYADMSQAAADKLEAIADNLGDHVVHLEYPDGLVGLVGLEA